MAWLECGGGGAEKPILLWENPNPTSRFGTQTLNIDFSKYSSLIIETNGYLTGGVTSNIQYNYIDFNLTKLSICGSYSYNGSAYCSWRFITLSSSAINFSQGKANNATEDGLCVPLKIYGFKKSLI
jgi:hypothetical protein